MTDMVALIRKVHAAVAAEREQRKRLVAEQHARLAAQYKWAAVDTLSRLEVIFVKAAQAGGNLDCLTAKVRALTSISGALPMTARHFQNGGMDVTADQLADQIIESMRAVAGGRAVEEGVL